MSDIIPKPDGVDLPDGKEWEDLSPRMRYYYRHREEEIERVQQRQDHLLEWVREVKAEQGCSKCDEDHPATLDYHHPNPDEKDRGVAKMAMDGLSKDRIREEMEKCELLCANCHRKEHW